MGRYRRKILWGRCRGMIINRYLFFVERGGQLRSLGIQWADLPQAYFQSSHYIFPWHLPPISPHYLCPLHPRPISFHYLYMAGKALPENKAFCFPCLKQRQSVASSAVQTVKLWSGCENQDLITTLSKLNFSLATHLRFRTIKPGIIFRCVPMHK